MNQPCSFTYTSSSPELSAAFKNLTHLIMLNCHIMGSYPPDKSASVYKTFLPTYDFIIVGAGSAGSAIAGRLSEIADWTILLIEAGTDPPINSDIPFLYSTLAKTPYDWNYTTEATGDTCLGSINNQCTWPRGKVMRGSSSTNFMIALRGNPKDYDNWESMGNTGWGYKQVLKYFQKLERLRIPKYTDKSAHGYDGNVYLELFTNKSVYNCVEAKNYIENYSNQAGYQTVPDMNAHHQAGITLLPGTLHDDARWNAAKAYLQPARKRPNLTVMKGTMVTKILIDDQNKAYGVEVFKDGEYKQIYCKKEVILSAGAINSPQLLMLSGVGPSDHLKKFRIPVKKNSCVGCNLRDHLAVRCFAGQIDKGLPSYSKTYPVSYYLKKYLTERKDMGLAFDAMLFLNTSGYIAEYPNIQIFYGISNRDSILGPFSANLFSMKPEFAKLSKNHATLELLPVLLRPKSHGRIFLKSTDPLVQPEIVTGYLTDRADIDVLIEALRLIEKISQNEAFKKYTTLEAIPVEDCLKRGRYSDAYYECLIRYFGATTFHPAGTCKMGALSDPNAVVSPELKVYGIEKLRVADASVMPQVPSGNINIPVIMIGEKASDLIKKDWLSSSSEASTISHSISQSSKSSEISSKSETILSGLGASGAGGLPDGSVVVSGWTTSVGSLSGTLKFVSSKT